MSPGNGMSSRVVHDVVIGNEFGEDGEQVFLGDGGTGRWFGWTRNIYCIKHVTCDTQGKLHIGAI